MLHGQETTLHGDKAYYKADNKLEWALIGGRCLMNKSGACTSRGDAINRSQSRIRAMVEDAIQVIRRQRGFTTVPYRELHKITSRVFMLCARVPRVRCGSHGVRTVRVLWAEPQSCFTLLFERLAIA